MNTVDKQHQPMFNGEESFFSLRPTSGKGTNPLGRVASFITTLFERFKGLFSSGDVMGNPGKFFSSRVVINYLDFNKRTEGFEHFSTYITETMPFHGTEEQIKKIKEFINDNSKKAYLAIPLVLPPLHFYEESHIVMIFIDNKKKTLEYFDPKGITSKNRELLNGNKMSNVLDTLVKVINDNNFAILENNRVLQLDCHNCGAYVDWFVKKRLKTNATAQTIISKGVSLEKIRIFRKEITSIIANEADRSTGFRKDITTEITDVDDPW